MDSNSTTFSKGFCRTCMNGNEENKIIEGKPISIFSEAESMECKNTTIMELLMLTTPQLNIDSGDMLPKIVCERCVESLLNVYKFQKMCITVEQRLREMIKEIPAESQTNEDLGKVNSSDYCPNDLAKTSKVNHTFIDQNAMTFCDGIVIADSEGIKFKMEKRRSMDISHNDFLVEADRDMDEWEISSNNARSLNQHKTIHLRTVSISQENILGVREEAGSINIECDDTKIVDIEKETQTSETNNGTEESSREDISHSDGSDKIESDMNCENKNFKLFSRRGNLRQHKKVHLRSAKVDHGPLFLLGSIGHNKKVARRKSSVNQKYECRVCQKVFCGSSALSTHQEIHTAEMPYLCPKCGKAFRTRSYLKRHFQRHGTERPYECPVCPKRFYCSSNLISHKAVHKKKEEKSHVCNICGAAFVQAFLLKKHSIFHSKEKKYKCDYCDRRFFLSHSCQTHMRIHTGEKPYQCKYCEKAFCEGLKLNNHLRVHLGDNNVYQCRLCPLRFPTAKTGREHFTTHKNDDEETKVRNLSKLNALKIRGTFFK